MAAVVKVINLKKGKVEVEEEDIKAFKRVDVVVAPSLGALFNFPLATQRLKIIGRNCT